MKQYPDRILHVEAPRKGHLIGWYKELQQKYGLTPAVRIDNPQAFVNQNHYKAGNLDIFFFANYSLTEAYTLDTEFNIDLRGRRMWLWDPMTGERALLPDTGTRLKLHLEPTESRLLGFDTLDYNVIYAQMGRGKTERVTAQALSSVAATLARLAMDNTMFLSQNFDFISYPAELTTGSSIMPHKKNPDVWELIRGKCNLLQGLPNQIAMMTTNLPLGYNRDLQLLKEVLFPAIADLRSCLSMAAFMLGNIRVKEHILDDPKYDYLFSVETVNNLVLSGVPFREAYRRVGLDIEQGRFKPQRQVHHTHEGSIGNPCNDEISALMQQTVERFDFGKVVSAEADLVK